MISSICLNAQVEVETDDQMFELLNNYEISTGKNLDSKSVFKLRYNGSLVDNLELSYERKLSPSFSIVAALSGERFYSFVPIEPIGGSMDSLIIALPVDSLSVLTSNFGVTQIKARFEVSVEGRYYIHQSDLVAQGFGNNINGLYVSAGLGYTLHDGTFDSVFDSDFPFFNFFGVGVQSRILKYGVLDFNIQASYKNERLKFAPNIKAGFAISKNYKTLDFNNSRCNILKCFEERNFQVKIPLTNSFSMQYRPSFNHAFLSISPAVKFEHRLLKGLSLNHTVQYSNLWNINNNASLSVRQSGSRFGYSNSIRWYVLKARNIASGRSADNLSGLYAESYGAITGGNIFRRDPNDIDNQIIIGKLRFINYGMNFGYQTRLFKRLYVDVQGYLRRTHIRYEYDDKEIDNLFVGNNRDWNRYGINLEFGLLF